MKRFPDWMRPHITLFMMRLQCRDKPEVCRAIVERAPGYARLTDEQMDIVEEVAVSHMVAAKALRDSCKKTTTRRD